VCVCLCVCVIRHEQVQFYLGILMEEVLRNFLGVGRGMLLKLVNSKMQLCRLVSSGSG